MNEFIYYMMKFLKLCKKVRKILITHSVLKITVEDLLMTIGLVNYVELMFVKIVFLFWIININVINLMLNLLHWLENLVEIVHNVLLLFIKLIVVTKCFAYNVKPNLIGKLDKLLLVVLFIILTIFNIYNNYNKNHANHN